MLFILTVQDRKFFDRPAVLILKPPLLLLLIILVSGFFVTGWRMVRSSVISFVHWTGGWDCFEVPLSANLIGIALRGTSTQSKRCHVDIVPHPRTGVKMQFIRSVKCPPVHARPACHMSVGSVSAGGIIVAGETYGLNYGAVCNRSAYAR